VFILFPGREGTLVGNVTWGLQEDDGGGGEVCSVLAAGADSGHVSDMSAMIAAQEEGFGGEAGFR